jgi:CheY-like chemotaxis protein
MRKRILIVEDDAFIAMLLEEFVALLGHDTAAVADRISVALGSLDEGVIDAAVVDVHLANGEMADAVAAALADRSIPFLVATGGFVGAVSPVWRGRPILSKPFSLEDLRKGLEPLLAIGTGEPRASLDHS